MFSFIYGSLISTKVEKYKKKSSNNLIMLLIFCVLISSVTQVFKGSKAPIVTNLCFIFCLLSLLLVFFFLQISKFQFLGDLNEVVNQDIYKLKDFSMEQSLDIISKQCQINKQKSYENQKTVEKIQDESRINFASNDIKITDNSNKIDKNNQVIKLNHQNNLNNYDQIVKNQIALNELQNQNKNIQDHLDQLESPTEEYNILSNKIVENTENIELLKKDMNNFTTQDDLDKYATMDDFNTFHNGIMHNSTSVLELKENMKQCKKDIDSLLTMDHLNPLETGVMMNGMNIDSVKIKVDENNKLISSNTNKIDELINQTSNDTSSNNAENYDAVFLEKSIPEAKHIYADGYTNNQITLNKLGNSAFDDIYNNSFETINYSNSLHSHYSPKGLLLDCVIKLSDNNINKIKQSINNIIESSGFLSSVAYNHINVLKNTNSLTSVALKDYLTKNPYANKMIQYITEERNKTIAYIEKTAANFDVNPSTYMTYRGAIAKDTLLSKIDVFGDYFKNSVQFQESGNYHYSKPISQYQNLPHFINPNKSMKAAYLFFSVITNNTAIMPHMNQNPYSDGNAVIYDPIRSIMNYYMATKSSIKNDVGLLQAEFIKDIKNTIHKPLEIIQNLLKSKVSIKEGTEKSYDLSAISIIGDQSELDILYDIVKELKKIIKLQISLQQVCEIDSIQSKNINIIAEHMLEEYKFYSNHVDELEAYKKKIYQAKQDGVISEEKYNELYKQYEYKRAIAGSFNTLYLKIYKYLTQDNTRQSDIPFEAYDFNCITFIDWMMEEYQMIFDPKKAHDAFINNVQPLDKKAGVFSGQRSIYSNMKSNFYQSQLSENIGYIKYLINKIEAMLIANKYEPNTDQLDRITLTYM